MLILDIGWARIFHIATRCLGSCQMPWAETRCPRKETSGWNQYTLLGLELEAGLPNVEEHLPQPTEVYGSCPGKDDDVFQICGGLSPTSLWIGHHPLRVRKWREHCTGQRSSCSICRVFLSCSERQSSPYPPQVPESVNGLP